MAISKPNRIISFLLIWMMVIGLSACSIPRPRPEEGIWYCEELMIEIDFGYLNENLSPECGKKYYPDGTYEDVLCFIDYGSGLFIQSEDYSEDYLNAHFTYRDGVFSVTTIEEQITYVFERID